MIEYFNPKGQRMARRQRERSRMYLAGLYAGWALVVLLGLYALGLLFATVIGPIDEDASPSLAFFLEIVWRTAYFGPAFAVLLLVVLAMLARNTRRGRAFLALEYVEQAVRLNLPLPQMIAAAEAAERGVMQRRLVRLREHLEDGAPIAVALQQSLPGLPPRAVALVQCGERLGRLPQALKRALRQPQPTPAGGMTHAILLRWYPVAMLVSVATVAAAVVTFVIPKYREILHEFHLTMPAITEWMAICWETLEAPLAIVALVLLAAYYGRILSEAMPTRRPRFEPWRSITDRLAWITPLWRGPVRNRGLADLCYVLADALDAGQPIHNALLEAAGAANNLILKKRVNHWAQLVIGGAPVAEAARAARMPALLSGMLATARGPDGTRDVFSFLARYYDTRFSAAAALLRAAAVPVMVAVTATMVVIIALSVFMPLIRLADVLSNPRGVL